ncbi:MAG: Acg family FMN-binding oxidoreductase [Hyphomicrobiales bacterium]
MRAASSQRDPWCLREEDFPGLCSASEKLRFTLRYATLAPSSHNSQPWWFRIVGDHVDLYADRTRALPVVDPEDRELTISCGAALFHLRIALRFFGYRDLTTVLPDSQDPDFLARVQIDGVHHTTDDERALFRAIVHRRTNRRAFADDPLPEDRLAAMEEAAEMEGGHLAVATEPGAREEIAKLVSRGDVIQMADPHFRRELASWIHPARHGSGDGMPSSVIGVNQILETLASPGVSLVVRTFDLGRGQAARDRALAEKSAALATVWTANDSPRHWLLAGQALARVLLVATDADISASYLNQPIEVAALRPMMAQAIGVTGHPQVLLRFGYGAPPEPTLRRPVEEVLA